jgi:hypothetical protein
MIIGQVGEQLAEKRSELESVPTRPAADDDPAHPVEDEVGVARIVVNATLCRDGDRVEGGQQPTRRVDETCQQYGVVS